MVKPYYTLNVFTHLSSMKSTWMAIPFTYFSNPRSYKINVELPVPHQACIEFNFAFDDGVTPPDAVIFGWYFDGSPTISPKLSEQTRNETR